MSIAWLFILCLLWLWPLTSHDGHVRAYGSYVDSIAYPWMTVLAGMGAMGFAAPAFHPALGIDGQSLPQG